jgi:TetR/AcrR family transcriptional repressor of nem operon
MTGTANAGTGAAGASRATGRGGKRDRLIAAARAVMYANGVNGTSLADVAAAADVPLGNVYYYFRTKEDLVGAVIQDHLDMAAGLLAAIEAESAGPGERLKSLFAALAGDGDQVARYGCPFGSLCMELDKRAEGPGPAAGLMRVPLAWMERQFAALGRPDARDLAAEAMARYQGAALLASTLRDPAILAAARSRAEAWIDSLPSTRPEN